MLLQEGPAADFDFDAPVTSAKTPQTEVKCTAFITLRPLPAYNKHNNHSLCAISISLAIFWVKFKVSSISDLKQSSFIFANQTKCQIAFFPALNKLSISSDPLKIIHSVLCMRK